MNGILYSSSYGADNHQLKVLVEKLKEINKQKRMEEIRDSDVIFILKTKVVSLRSSAVR